MLLNDVRPEQRLAYMLTPTLARYQGRRQSRWPGRLALLGAGTLVLRVLWELFQKHYGHWSLGVV